MGRWRVGAVAAWALLFTHTHTLTRLYVLIAFSHPPSSGPLEALEKAQDISDLLLLSTR